MACTSTRPLPELPLAVPVAADVSELQARCLELERQNDKLKQINTALIERVESVHARGDDAYTAFQHSVVLAEQVRERTDALNQAMAELKSSNQLLSDARLRAETAHQHLIDVTVLEQGHGLFVQHRAVRNQHLLLVGRFADVADHHAPENAVAQLDHDLAAFDHLRVDPAI